MPPPSRIPPLLLLLTLLLLAAPAAAQDGFDDLDPDQRVVDRTGESLTEAQAAQLRDQLADLAEAGADGIVLVRALDASPEETLDQVEALQQAWAATSGADEDTAAAILINRNPDDPEDARAGVYVGRELREGNVPEDEQVAIVEEALIPPLREGDVFASLSAGLERLTTSVREGPPPDPFATWAAGPAGTWTTWLAVVAAVAIALAAAALDRRRATADVPGMSPTTSRPGDLSPGLAGALVAGQPMPTALPATVLDLAARGALAIEPAADEDDGIAVRLLDRSPVAAVPEPAVWAALESHATGGLVDHDALRDLAGSHRDVDAALAEGLRAEGWIDEGAPRRRIWLGLLATAAFVLGIAAVVIGVAGQTWAAAGAGGLLGAVAIVCLLLLSRHHRLSAEGQVAAAPWRAYGNGLGEAVQADAVPLDLDAVLPDLVAFGLGAKADDRVQEAAAAGRTLRAFTSPHGDVSPALYTVLWAGFHTSTTAPAGGAGATVSGAGAGGGGGAAGST